MAKKRLKELEGQGGRTEKATDGLTASFQRLIGPIAAVVSVSAGLTKLVDSARQFSVLNAGLKTATGSMEGASEAFEVLEDFAASTPYALEQSVDAFTKLVNLGLDPSERAMRSYGNTSAAMGKDMTQMIEAVADASTFEFERLKEFGVKSKQQGDNVSFAFRGVTTTVKKEASEIEGYLINLGESNFATAMSDRMETFDGLLSNLGDSWDQLFRNINNQGVGSAMSDAVRLGISALEELNAMIKSGELEAYFKVVKSKFSEFGEDFEEMLVIVNDFYSDFTLDVSGKARLLGEDLANAFKNLPENVRAMIQIMVTELAVFIDKTAAYGKEILENLTFWKDETFDLDAELERLDSIRMSSIETILLEREAAVTSSDAQIQKVKELRTEYDELIEKKRLANEGVDRLEKFSQEAPEVLPDGESGLTDKEEKQSGKYEKELERLDDFLATKEEKLLAAYEQNQLSLGELEEAGVINEIEQYGYLLSLEEKFQADKQKTQMDGLLAEQRIWSSGWKGKASIVQGTLGAIQGYLASGNKKQVEESKRLGKVLIKASAAIGYAKAYELGWPLGPLHALEVTAMAATQLNNLESVSYGGGGLSASGASYDGSSTTFSPSTPSYSNPRENEPNPGGVHIIFNNTQFIGGDDERVKDMVKTAVQELNGEGTVLIDEGSYNAELLKQS